jgi:uncharacterized protein YjdB
MSQVKKILLPIFLCFILIIYSFPIQATSAKTSSSFSFVVLIKGNTTVDIGNEFYIIALASNGNTLSWKSSNSKIASVNTYGKVTAKKSGTATITAKIKNAEASCKVTVNKTQISISKVSASIERGETLQLSTTTTNNSVVTWKSSKKSIATIDKNGNVTGIKPGETTITATADGSNATCKIKVKTPTIKLNKTSIKLYRGQSAKLSATVSSGVNPTWKTSRESIAVVDGFGTITAIKHGTTKITATVDGVSKSCEVVVEKPIIALNSLELSLKKGTTATITATVSSSILPVWSSSNSKIITVNTTGRVTALKKGTAYIYAAEDGVKVRCIIHVTE